MKAQQEEQLKFEQNLLQNILDIGNEGTTIEDSLGRIGDYITFRLKSIVDQLSTDQQSGEEK